MTPVDPASDSSLSAQALSDRLKEAVKAWVPKVRHALDNEFAAQLDRLGIRRDGKHRPLDKMSMPEASVATRRRVEALVLRESLSEGTPERGYDNVKRELTYTLLNRLVGLKAMEARRLLYLPPPGQPNAALEETEVVTPVPGQGRSRYLRDFRAAANGRYKYEEMTRRKPFFGMVSPRPSALSLGRSEFSSIPTTNTRVFGPRMPR